LTYSLLFTAHPEFEGQTLGDFFQALNPWRVKVAHAITEASDFFDLDSYVAVAEIVPSANLVDMVARQVLLDEIELTRRIHAGSRVNRNVRCSAAGFMRGWAPLPPSLAPATSGRSRLLREAIPSALLLR